MPKLGARWTATAGAGKYAGGNGLYLFVTPEGGRGWRFIYSLGGKRRTMSLAPFKELSLAEAREAAIGARKQVRAGVDPIEARRARSKTVPTFGAAAEEFISSRQAVWRGRWAER